MKKLIIIIFLGFVSSQGPAQEKNLIKVKGGTFMMGYTKEYVKGTREGGMYRDVPPHKVMVSDFYISPYEVTQKEFEDTMGFNPSYFKGDKKPVENVTWYDAIRFCNLLSRKEGLSPCYTISGEDVTCDFMANGYRLLTEAEWEYAAHGGAISSVDDNFSGSDNADDVAWTKENSSDKTHNVGEKKPNGLGIFDMSGNVSEWCWDWFETYSEKSQVDPKGPDNATHRVERGGSWKYPAEASGITRRHFVLPGNAYYRLGFRLGRSSV